MRVTVGMIVEQIGASCSVDRLGNHSFRRTDNHVVLTHELDFGAILAATHGKNPSVVQIRVDDVSPENLGALVAAALRQAELELETRALLTIDTKRTRMSILPLQRRR